MKLNPADIEVIVRSVLIQEGGSIRSFNYKYTEFNTNFGSEKVYKFEMEIVFPVEKELRGSAGTPVFRKEDKDESIRD